MILIITNHSLNFGEIMAIYMKYSSTSMCYIYKQCTKDWIDFMRDDAENGHVGFSWEKSS
jgi:hypothetical protein